MPPIIFALTRFFVVFVIEFLAFFFFYRRPEGRKAVYFSWYAWVIDALAIFSGSMIMFWSIYALHHPWIFAVQVPQWIFWLSFIIGSWQAGIHGVKVLLRAWWKNWADINKMPPEV